MVKDTSVSAINAELAKQINREARANPNSPYANKFVGIVNGKVVVVADTLRQADLSLDAVESDPTKCYIVDASADYDAIQEIWGDY
jgi:hypoxanthine-guanine phosphoribosyltransferase